MSDGLLEKMLNMLRGNRHTDAIRGERNTSLPFCSTSIFRHGGEKTETKREYQSNKIMIGLFLLFQNNLRIKETISIRSCVAMKSGANCVIFACPLWLLLVRLWHQTVRLYDTHLCHDRQCQTQARFPKFASDLSQKSYCVHPTKHKK